MIASFQQLSGDVFSLHNVTEGELTLRRFSYVEDAWVLLESTCLRTFPGQRVVAFEAVWNERTASKGLFLALAAQSDVPSKLGFFECARNPLRILQLASFSIDGISTAHILFRGPQLLFINQGILCKTSSDNTGIDKLDTERLKLEDVVLVTTVLSADLIVARTNSSMHFFLYRKNRAFGEVPGKYFLPNEYVLSIRSIHVTVSQNAIGVLEALKENATCICTSNKHFVVFTKGAVRYTCVIPFPVDGMWRYQTNFVLRSVRQGVCILRRVTGEIQVSKIWNEAVDALSGDFAHCGRTCLLLVKGREFSPSEVVDLFGYENSTTPTNHSSVVVGALQKRLCIAQNAVARAEDEARQKQRLVDAVRWKIPRDPSLIQVISNSDRPIVTSPVAKSVQVLNHWNSIHRDVLIVGWMLQCTDTNMESLQAHLSAPSQCCEYIRGVSCHDREAKIVILAKIPAFATPVVKVTAILSWRTNDGQSHWKSFDVVLDVTRVLISKPLVAKDLEALECVRMAQQSSSFRINIEQTRISRLLSTNQSLHTLLMSDGAEAYAFVDEQSPLFGINFQINTSHTQLEIHFRDEAQLLLFVHWLYATIPEGFLLLPLSPEDSTLAKDHFREELQFVQENGIVTRKKYSQFRNQLLKKELKTDRSIYNFISHFF